MADVTGGPGLFAQIRLVAELRWRTLGNLIRKRNSRLDLIGLVFATFITGLFIVGLYGLF